IGYAGRRKAAPILMEGLSSLEYRGYDSAGIAVIDPEGRPQVLKASGKLKPTTRDWLASARNYALYSNESGLYDDVLSYLKIRK
ncbi:MAG: hypothetical protein QF541_05680, partial [Lentisphaeria bacterium]|nr:hypothetical protein [Lentisphaeria bacterium]